MGKIGKYFVASILIMFLLWVVCKNIKEVSRSNARLYIVSRPDLIGKFASVREACEIYLNDEKTNRFARKATLLRQAMLKLRRTRYAVVSCKNWLFVRSTRMKIYYSFEIEYVHDNLRDAGEFSFDVIDKERGLLLKGHSVAGLLDDCDNKAVDILFVPHAADLQ